MLCHILLDISFSFSLWFEGSLFSLLHLYYFALFFLKPSLLPQVAGCCVDLHDQWNGTTHGLCASVLRS